MTQKLHKRKIMKKVCGEEEALDSTDHLSGTRAVEESSTMG